MSRLEFVDRWLDGAPLGRRRADNALLSSCMIKVSAQVKTFVM